MPDAAGAPGTHETAAGCQERRPAPAAGTWPGRPASWPPLCDTTRCFHECGPGINFLVSYSSARHGSRR